jgi:predicted ATPase/transcriptional regulator with XRE-family HTH domain
MSIATSLFASLLRQARHEANLTQAALAEQARLSARTVQHLEEGRGLPYPATAARLADALGLSGEMRSQFEFAARRSPRAADGSAQPAQAERGASHLPSAWNTLVGREREVAAVAESLCGSNVRLLTLTGTGGVGKTRVALQVASDVADAFADGVYFVDLSSVADPTLTVTTIARSLGVRDLGKRPVLDSLKAHLLDKSALVVLDNFEQILPAATAVADLIAACPGIKILVTSRAHLRLQVEHVVEVLPLVLPEPGLNADAIGESPAVELFVRCSTRVRSDFRLNDQNADAVADICRRLDGLPLAIELAAARLKLLDANGLLMRLEPRMPLLTGGARDLPARQRTLADTINWSYDLLDDAGRYLFRRLSVFVGGCTLVAIESVCAPQRDAPVELRRSPDTGVLDGLTTLVDLNLLRRLAGPDGEPRFIMLETVREYASERLIHSGDAEAVQRRHAAYYLRFVELARPQLRGPQARGWLDRIEADQANLYAAIDWGESVGERLDDAEDSVEGLSGLEVATRIVEAVAWFWMLRSHLPQGWRRLQRLLEATRSGTSAHARALLVAGALAHYLDGGPLRRCSLPACSGPVRRAPEARCTGRRLRTRPIGGLYAPARASF